jgi:phenylpyruvate tautomerase PptA (4-oxalocrotonate tautomerase family)
LTTSLTFQDERITEQDPQRLAAAVSDLFVDAVLPPPERTVGQGR